MKLEYQVCSFEQAKRLSELGVVQGSSFCFWNASDNGETATITINSRPVKPYFYGAQFCFSAFTIAELGEACPYAMNTYYSEHTGCWNWQLVEFTEGNRPAVWAAGDAEYNTEAQARADCLIHSIKNNYITIDEVNQRLQ